MKILAIDTSTDACSAALSLAGEIHERFELAPRAHSQLILPMLESLLAEAGIALTQLDAIAFGCGPGSFTGVRIAAGVTQGIAFGANLPVVPVSTLAALAQGACDELGLSHVLAALDARMHEVYWGAYSCSGDGIVHLQDEEGVYTPDRVPMPMSAQWAGVGSGWVSYGTALHTRLAGLVTATHAQRHPRARDVARLGAYGLQHKQAVSAEQALPVYIRNGVTWKKNSK